LTASARSNHGSRDQSILASRQFAAKKQGLAIFRRQSDRPVRRDDGARLIALHPPVTARVDPVFRIVPGHLPCPVQRRSRRRHIAARHVDVSAHAHRGRGEGGRNIVRLHLRERGVRIALQKQGLRHQHPRIARPAAQSARLFDFALRSTPVAQIHQCPRLCDAGGNGARIGADGVQKLDAGRARIALDQRGDPARQRGGPVRLMQAPLPPSRRRQQQGGDARQQEQALAVHALTPAPASDIASAGHRAWGG